MISGKFITIFIPEFEGDLKLFLFRLLKFSLKNLEGHVQDVPTVRAVARRSFIWTAGANKEARYEPSAMARMSESGR